MKSTKITIGEKASQDLQLSAQSDGTLTLSNKGRYLMTIPESNTLHMQRQGSNISITISPDQLHSQSVSISSLQNQVVRWADSVYPLRTQEDILVKFLEEVAELFKNPSDPLELADLMILLLDLFKSAGIDDPTIPTLEKLAVNEKRKWQIDKKTGIMNHVPRS